MEVFRSMVRLIPLTAGKRPGGMWAKIPIQPVMKQPTSQEERNQDKKKPEENPSRGIDPETEKPEMEVVDQDPGERQKENQNRQKDDPLAA
jgi:hypothetical protein